MRCVAEPCASKIAIEDEFDGQAKKSSNPCRSGQASLVVSVKAKRGSHASRRLLAPSTSGHAMNLLIDSRLCIDPDRIVIDYVRGLVGEIRLTTIVVGAVGSTMSPRRRNSSRAYRAVDPVGSDE